MLARGLGQPWLRFSRFTNGRGDWIRTNGLLVPNQALYQAKLRPEKEGVKRGVFGWAVKNILKSWHNGRTTRGVFACDASCAITASLMTH
jgi:hypothetical protein